MIDENIKMDKLLKFINARDQPGINKFVECNFTQAPRTISVGRIPREKIEVVYSHFGIVIINHLDYISTSSYFCICGSNLEIGPFKSVKFCYDYLIKSYFMVSDFINDFEKNAIDLEI